MTNNNDLVSLASFVDGMRTEREAIVELLEGMQERAVDPIAKELIANTIYTLKSKEW